MEITMIKGVKEMNVTTIKTGGKQIFKVAGILDTVTAPALEAELKKTELDGVSELVFDLSELEYISSAGLRVLLIAQKKMIGNGEFTVCGANETVKEILDITGFSDIFNVI